MELAESQRRLNKLYTDMYEGEGIQNPSVTTRLVSLEKADWNKEERVQKIEDKIDKGMWMLLASLIAGFIQILILAFKH